MENRLYLQDYRTKSLETLHVKTDHQNEDHRSSFMVTKVTDTFPDLVLVEQIFNDIKWLATVSNFRQISTSQSTHEYFGKERD